MSTQAPLRTRRAPGRAALTAVLVLAASACGDAHPPLAPGGDPVPGAEAFRAPAPAAQPLTVYTQNAYLGGDTGPIFDLDFSDIPALLQATNAFWSDVRASDVPGRMSAIADEIQDRRPHLVGLQEVFRFVAVDPRTGTVHAHLDLLALLQAELAARGVGYELVRVQDNTAAALPLAVDFSTGQMSLVLSLTDRIAVLRRADVAVADVAQGTYAARYQVGPLNLRRGWIRVATEHHGVPYHFVTTHLEVQRLAPVQAGQAAELLGSVVAGLDGVVVLTGDLNSDAAAGPGAPSWTPTYSTLLQAGFVDAWLQATGPDSDGFTCCQATDLRNAVSELDERIDFVLIRNPGDPMEVDRTPGAIFVELVGEEPDDRTAGGLWRADHAGLVAGLRLPPGLARKPRP